MQHTDEGDENKDQKSDKIAKVRDQVKGGIMGGKVTTTTKSQKPSLYSKFALYYTLFFLLLINI